MKPLNIAVEWEKKDLTKEVHVLGSLGLSVSVEVSKETSDSS